MVVVVVNFVVAVVIIFLNKFYFHASALEVHFDVQTLLLARRAQTSALIRLELSSHNAKGN